ncbi:MAG: hypothetical protein J2P28_03705 [Actinobacteria bacterium]|nr:hypothetical protein [Actinomycetota bacterium]MBO0834612.1 hypothetical protein [Actinomycetota bacterium]
MPKSGSPPRRTSRPSEENQSGPEPERRRRIAKQQRPSWQVDAFGPEDTDASVPSWAGPSDYAPKPGRTRRRAAPDLAAGEAGTGSAEEPAEHGDAAGGETDGSTVDSPRMGRAAATRLRKSRRRVYRWSAIGIVVCVVAGAIAVFVTRNNAQPPPYVTSLLPGEFKSVPSACSSISTTVLTQYLPGGSRTMTNQFSEPTQSQCSFTVDAKPVFRLLEVSAQAFEPFAAASGNGSASANARDNLALTKAALIEPPKTSPLSPAKITPVSALGEEAFAANQNESAAGITSTVVTVVVLERNVLITVQLSAQETAGFTGSAQTPVATLQAGATAAASEMLAKVQRQPTV